jgi:hypothetical protein
MLEFIEYMSVTVVVIVFNQFYAYATTRIGKEKQGTCQNLGIVNVSLGVVSLVTHNTPVVFGGLILIMMGLRLIAHGLDRIDKNIFIDRYDPKE